MKHNVTAQLSRQFIITFQPCSNSHNFIEDNVQKSILVFMQVYCINVHKSMQAQCNNVRKVLHIYIYIYRIAIIAGTAIFEIPQQCSNVCKVLQIQKHSNVCNSTAVQQCL